MAEVMNRAQLVRLSNKQMSYLLRHRPEDSGLVLDAEGYVPLADLLVALRKENSDVTEADIWSVVETVEIQKQRFSISDGEIRANYGHSRAGKIQYVASTPPPILLHGTADSNVAQILATGLHPMKRQYVHLTTNTSIALTVGSRHGKPVVISVDAIVAWKAGISFYPSNDTFWLADFVPAQYLRIHVSKGGKEKECVRHGFQH